MPSRKKTTVVESPAPVVTPEPEPVKPDPVPVETSSVDEPSATSQDSFLLLGDKLSSVISELKTLQNVVKNLQKEHNKLKKLAAKKTKSRGSKVDGQKANRAESGFAKPTLLSNALCDFLGVDKGSVLARTEVTRKINEYIKAQKLQSEADKRVIVPDDKLKSILDIKEGQQLSFFNLQACLKNHFIKSTPVAA